MNTEQDPFPTEMIRAQLGGRVPEILWYISPELVDKLPLDTIEALTYESKLWLEAERMQNGGLLILVLASQTSTDKVEVMLGALGALNHITPSENV